MRLTVASSWSRDRSELTIPEIPHMWTLAPRLPLLRAALEAQPNGRVDQRLPARDEAILR